MTSCEIIDCLGLKPLPFEGGYFRETYRSTDNLPADILGSRYGRHKSLGTAIYYMLTPDSFSAMHRLPTDEIFHFYLGDPVEMLQLLPDGASRRIVLGHDLLAGQQPQLCVPRGVWQGSRLLAGGRFALMGTTMAPGFDFADFEGGRATELAAHYPAEAGLIRELARG